MQTSYSFCPEAAGSAAPSKRKAPLDVEFPIKRPKFDIKLEITGLAKELTPSQPDRLSNQTLITRSTVESPTSSSLGSSFSHGLASDSGSNASSAPSTPKTPVMKYEFDEAEVDTCGNTSNANRPRLPSFDQLLMPAELYGGRSLPTEASRCEQHLQTPSPSPEATSEYAYYWRKPSMPLSGDPITSRLNEYRMEKDQSKTLLPPLGNLSEVPRLFSFPQNATSHHHAADRRQAGTSTCFWSTPLYHPHYQPRQPRQHLSPFREMRKKRRAKSKAEWHCNIKYTVEQTDYIRYQKRDLNKPWDEALRRYQDRFPMLDPAHKRQSQGIQGVHYRDNAHLPHLIDGRRLAFTREGHVAVASVKVRKQTDNKEFFTLLRLYPERAMHYSWVRPEDRQFAAQYHQERMAQKAEARREAEMLGLWQDTLKPGMCACCKKEDEEKDTVKREIRRRNNRDFSKMSRL
ncbi:hypothetical protein F4780DRAFT_553426 [Xylariomycetidae sp. FL0641]|nr:hypothetical protein F4780DRAFT_553426 [Xylariomycetidae sp. FL0641]